MVTHIQCIKSLKAMSEFAAFQLQSATSAPYMTTREGKQGHSHPSGTSQNDFSAWMLSQGGQDEHTSHGCEGRTSTARQQALLGSREGS